MNEVLTEQQALLKIRLVTGKEGLNRIIDHPRIQKPSLAFAGLIEKLSDFQLQVIGETELNYLAIRTADERSLIINNFFDFRVAAVIVTRGIIPSAEIISAAKRTETPLLVSELPSSELMINMMMYLSKRLAPKITHHGVFMDIFGQGVLLLADSGVGKSEIALELITRGHRLVADDMVELSREAPDTLVGHCPKNSQNYLEVRGLGFINVRNLFGSAAITQSKRVTLIVRCVLWDDFAEENRVDTKVTKININGVSIPSVTIPVRSGRSMAVLVEVATRNESMRKLGVNDNQIFIEQMNKRIHG